MKNILIPTDFSIASLECIHDLCQQYEGKSFRLIFIHLFKISDSITELLLLSKRNREYEYVSDEFYKGCENIKDKYPQVETIKVDFFYGSTLSMFRNYLEAHCINAVLELKSCSLQPLNKMSVNPETLIQKCGLEIVRIQPELKKVATNPTKDQILQETI